MAGIWWGGGGGAGWIYASCHFEVSLQNVGIIHENITVLLVDYTDSTG